MAVGEQRIRASTAAALAAWADRAVQRESVMAVAAAADVVSQAHHVDDERFLNELAAGDDVELEGALEFWWRDRAWQRHSRSR
jgi:hypothetical protein